GAQRHGQARAGRLFRALVFQVSARAEQGGAGGSGDRRLGVRALGVRALGEPLGLSELTVLSLALRCGFEARVRVRGAAAGARFCLRIDRGLAASRSRQQQESETDSLHGTSVPLLREVGQILLERTAPIEVSADSPA